MNILQKILALPADRYIPILSSIGVLSITNTQPTGNDTDRHIEVNLVEFNGNIDKDWTSRNDLNSKIYVRLPLFLEGELVRRTRSTSYSKPNLHNFVTDFPHCAEAIAVALANLETSCSTNPDYVWKTKEILQGPPIEQSFGWVTYPTLEVPTYYEVTSMFYIHNSLSDKIS